MISPVFALPVVGRWFTLPLTISSKSTHELNERRFPGFPVVHVT